MVTVKNHLGKIRYTKNFFYNLISSAVTSCFGVAGLMPKSKYDEILCIIPVINKLHEVGKGINIRISEGKIRIALHIQVVYGTNTSALTQNISEKISFVIKEQTGLEVEDVNVFIDGLVN